MLISSLLGRQPTGGVGHKTILSTRQEMAGRSIPEMTYLCQVGHNTLTQSLTQSQNLQQADIFTVCEAHAYLPSFRELLTLDATSLYTLACMTCLGHCMNAEMPWIELQ